MPSPAARGLAPHPPLRIVRQRSPRQYRTGARIARRAVSLETSRDVRDHSRRRTPHAAAPLPVLRRPHDYHRDLRGQPPAETPPRAHSGRHRHLVMPSHPCSASRLNQWCEVLDEAAANRIIHVHRGTRVQKERADRLLLHLFQHQIHHRGQAHAMLSGNVCAAATTRRILLGRRGTVARGRIQRAWIDRGDGLAGVRLLDHMSPVAPRHITERGHGEVRC